MEIWLVFDYKPQKIRDAPEDGRLVNAVLISFKNQGKLDLKIYGVTVQM